MPWEELPKVWKTESAFWVWMKGVIRKGWSRHPIKLEFIKTHRKRITNPNPRGNKPEVWGAECSMCHRDFVQADLEVNHKGSSATLTQIDDIQACVEKLLIVNFDDLELLCKPCHGVYSLAQSRGISLEEARIEKEVVQFKGMKVADQTKVLTALLDADKLSKITNATQRVAAYRKHLVDNE